MAGQFIARREIGTLLNIDFSETSQPSSAEVENFILSVESEVIGSINVAKLAIPTKALSPISYEIIRGVVRDGVAAMTQAAYGGNVLNLSPREEMFHGRYLEGRTRIEQYPRSLPDAIDLTGVADTDMDSTFLHSDISHDNVFAMDDEY